MRTVVSFEPLGAQTIVKLEDAPDDVPGLGVNETADVSPPPGGDVMAVGSVLLQRLWNHPHVQAGLERAFTRPPGSPAAPVYFHVVASEADRLPWEQVYGAGHGFYALDARWPIGRIAQRRRPLTDRGFTAPLRIVAVLAAAQRTGLPQLRSLLAAIAGPDAQAIGVHLHVITGEEAVLEEVAAIARPNVSAEKILGKAGDVARQITLAGPHVLHVLCHGGMVAGLRTLALATIGDFDDAAATGSVRLKVADLVAALTPCDPWLVVLAACESADAVDGQALAHELAAGGIPAVIAMRRMVDLGDTNALCAALYPEVLRIVRAAVDPAGPPGARTVEWASALTAPRQALAGADPVAVDSWSDPVLYVQADPLRVFAGSHQLSPADYTGMRGQLDVWEGYLAAIEAGADPALVAEIEAKVADLRDAMGPDA